MKVSDQLHAPSTLSPVSVLLYHIYITNTMEQSSQEADSHSAGQEIACLLWIPRAHYHVHLSPLLDPVLNKTKPVHIPTPYFFKVHFSIILQFMESHDSLVSIALGYGLDDQGSRVWFLAGAGNFSLHHCIQNGSGAHPASYPMGTRGSFPGGKAAGAWS
jgi:hypothetical protein